MGLTRGEPSSLLILPQYLIEDFPDGVRLTVNHHHLHILLQIIHQIVYTHPNVLQVATNAIPPSATVINLSSSLFNFSSVYS